MFINPDATYIVFECACRKLYKIPLSNYSNKDSFEFICTNCSRKIKCSYVENGHEKDYFFDKIIDEDILDEIIIK